MSMSYVDERSLLGHDEFEAVKKTHYPMISDLSLDALKELKGELRQIRDRQRTLAFRKSRVSRGKEEPRTVSGGNVDHAKTKKQVFSHALKRLSREIERLAKYEARSHLIRAQHSALALRRKNLVVHHPTGGQNGNDGMQTITNKKSKRTHDRRKLGRLLQQNKVNQVRRDARSAAR